MRYLMVCMLLTIALGAGLLTACGDKGGVSAGGGSAKDQAPLLAAVVEGDLAKLGQILESGADVNVRDKNGNTALHLAAEYDDVEMIQLLAKHGADFSIVNNRNSTPEDWADYQGKQAAVNACRELKKH